MRHFWLLVITLISITTVSGQGIITGNILDETGQPAPFANILLMHAADSTLAKGGISFEDGTYVFESIPAGPYYISASTVGYDAIQTDVFKFDGGDYTVPSISFNQSGVELEVVTVSATKPFMELKNDKLIIHVSSSPLSAGNTALELLSKAPGIVIDQNNNLTMKGKSGVLIMIDGKNTYMSVQEIIRMLETTPADHIESFEIIDNPSAKYDAQGNAGLINIRMKKDKSLGLNGNVSLGAGYGILPKAITSFRMNYREKDFNLYGNYGYYFKESFQELGIERNILSDAGLVQFMQNNDRDYTYQNHNASVGFDYFLNDKTTLGVLGNLRQGTWDAFARNRTNISGANQEPFTSIDADNDALSKWNNYTGNINLKHQFNEKGHAFTVDADYAYYEKTDDLFNSNSYLGAGNAEVIPPGLLRSDNFSGVTIRALKTDYTYPVSEKFKIEAGAKVSAVTTDNQINFTLFEDGDWVNDPLRSNQFQYEENIIAGYVNLSTQWKIFNLQLGLRGENTYSDGYSVTLDQRVERSYFNLFPSAAISHQIGENQSLSYTISRRIDRPSYQDLNPFIFYLDQYTFSLGNPFLQPQLSNSFGLTYSIQNKLMVNINYSKTTDVMQEIVLQNDEAFTTFQTKQNLDNFHNLSIASSLPIGITKWWSSRINLVGFYNKFESEFSNDPIDLDQWSARLNLNNNFTLPHGMRAELSGFYQSKVIWGIFNMDPRWSLDAGVSIPVLHKAGSLKVNINDIFNSDQTYGFINQGSIDVDVEELKESRRINLTFNYTFGNTDVKPSRNRRTATDDERNRVKN